MRDHLGAIPSGFVVSYVVLLARCLAHRRFFSRALAWIDQLLWLAGVVPATGSAAAATVSRRKCANTDGGGDTSGLHSNSNDFPQIGLPLSQQGKLFYVKCKVLTMWINCCAPLAHGVRGARLDDTRTTFTASDSRVPSGIRGGRRGRQAVADALAGIAQPNRCSNIRWPPLRASNQTA
jgi:hypothetical protein